MAFKNQPKQRCYLHNCFLLRSLSQFQRDVNGNVNFRGMPFPVFVWLLFCSRQVDLASRFLLVETDNDGEERFDFSDIFTNQIGDALVKSKHLIGHFTLMIKISMLNVNIPATKGISSYQIAKKTLLRDDVRTKKTFQFGHCPNWGGVTLARIFLRPFFT